MAASVQEISNAKEEQLFWAKMAGLHLFPGAVTILLMLIASSVLDKMGIFPSVPVLFILIAPVLILIEIGYLYAKGKELNGKFSLQGIVLYREEPMPWWKIMLLAIPVFAWIALVWFIVKPPVNQFFIEHFFAWVPVNFLDDTFIQNLNQYSPTLLVVIGILFPISITLGGMVEELYFRGYLLPRMESLGAWAPVVNILLFSIYHFWTPWENVVRLVALSPWIFVVWRTRNLYFSLFIHFTINAFAGISMLNLILNSM